MIISRAMVGLNPIKSAISRQDHEEIAIVDAFYHIFHRGFDKWQVLGVDAASEAAKNEDEMRPLANFRGIHVARLTHRW